MIANTPEPPYYAVIFSSVRTKRDSGYDEMANKMVDLAKSQDGFLGIESAQNKFGITVTYWTDIESITNWIIKSEQSLESRKERELWYDATKVRISKVERDYDFRM